MEEKKLLKEITYLSRLIGEHKKNLRSDALSTVPNKNQNRNNFRQRTIHKYSGGHFKFLTKYSKVNKVTSENSSAIKNVSEIMMKQPQFNEKKMITSIIESQIEKQSISNLKEFSDTSMNVSASTTSVHINPNFFRGGKSLEEETAMFRCKSVHINPKLLDVVAQKTNLIGCDKAVTSCVTGPSSSQTINMNIDFLSSTENLPCRPQPTTIPHEVLNEKSNIPSVPLRTPGLRKRYVFRSKNKLVKVISNAPSPTSVSMKKNSNIMIGQSSGKTIKTPQGGTLLSVSRTKLVRLPGKSRRLSASKSPTANTPTDVIKSRYSLKRSGFSQSSALVRTARKVCSKYRSATAVMVLGASSKYKLDHRLLKNSRKEKHRSGNKYKVDHRSSTNNSTASRAPCVQRHLLFSPMRRSLFSNKIWMATLTPRTVQKVAISHKRLSKIGRNPGSTNYVQNSSLVRIGGLLYKSSRNKLILSKTPDKKAANSVKLRTVVKRRSLNSGNIVYVRGNKFVMDQSGKTLKRVLDGLNSPPSQNRKKSQVNRVDFGGVTFIQKSPSVLVRTNTHTARNVVCNAKQRSIAYLAKKMRKINTPCLFYRRFGRCPRVEKGRCELVHDPKYIDICQRFLQGKCSLEGCLLSHDVGPEKMPTCRFFLEGCCVRDSCPYLHVKVNDRAPICLNFLQGYCTDGPECLKRHLLLCPEFDKKGSCVKGKYCPYPHPTAPRLQRTVRTDTSNDCNENQSNHSAPKRKRYYETDSEQQNDNCKNSPVKNKRYFEADRALEEQCQLLNSDVEKGADNNYDYNSDDGSEDHLSSCEEAPVKRRPKIGDLPSFIALESSELELF